MRTLKRVGAMVLTAVMLFSFVGCKKKQKGHDGAKSVQELVTKVVGVINGDIKYSEIESWMANIPNDKKFLYSAAYDIRQK